MFVSDKTTINPNYHLMQHVIRDEICVKYTKMCEVYSEGD